jgi:hypothetical protein
VVGCHPTAIDDRSWVILRPFSGHRNRFHSQYWQAFRRRYLVQPSYRREAPRDGMSQLKKQPNSISPFASITSKSDLNAITIGHFYDIIPLWTGNKKKSVYSWEKKLWSTENSIRPNRDDRDHVLIITIGVDSGDRRTIKTSCFLQSFKKWQSARSLKRCAKIIVFTKRAVERKPILSIPDHNPLQKWYCKLHMQIHFRIFLRIIIKKEPTLLPPMPIQASNWSAIDETCNAQTQQKISRDLSKFGVRNLHEQVYLMNSIIRNNLGIQITDRQLSALFHYSGRWA